MTAGPAAPTSGDSCQRGRAQTEVFSASFESAGATAEVHRFCTEFFVITRACIIEAEALPESLMGNALGHPICMVCMACTTRSHSTLHVRFSTVDPEIPYSGHHVEQAIYLLLNRTCQNWPSLSSLSIRTSIRTRLPLLSM